MSKPKKYFAATPILDGDKNHVEPGHPFECSSEDGDALVRMGRAFADDEAGRAAAAKLRGEKAKAEKPAADKGAAEKPAA